MLACYSVRLFCATVVLCVDSAAAAAAAAASCCRCGAFCDKMLKCFVAVGVCLFFFCRIVEKEKQNGEENADVCFKYCCAF